MLCYAMLCYAMLCYAMLCYVVHLAREDVGVAHDGLHDRREVVLGPLGVLLRALLLLQLALLLLLLLRLLVLVGPADGKRAEEGLPLLCALALAALFLLTGNVVTTLLASASLFCATLTLLSLLVACGWELGVTEAVLACATPALLAPPLALVVRAYLGSAMPLPADRPARAPLRRAAPTLPSPLAPLLRLAPPPPCPPAPPSPAAPAPHLASPTLAARRPLLRPPRCPARLEP